MNRSERRRASFQLFLASKHPIFTSGSQLPDCNGDFCGVFLRTSSFLDRRSRLGWASFEERTGREPQLGFISGGSRHPSPSWADRIGIDATVTSQSQFRCDSFVSPHTLFRVA